MIAKVKLTVESLPENIKVEEEGTAPTPPTSDTRHRSHYISLCKCARSTHYITCNQAKSDIIHKGRHNVDDVRCVKDKKQRLSLVAMTAFINVASISGKGVVVCLMLASASEVKIEPALRASWDRLYRQRITDEQRKY